MTDTAEATQADREAAVKLLTDWITVEQMMHGDNSALGRAIEALLTSQAFVDKATRELLEALAPFLKHRPECAVLGHWMEASDTDCNCGLKKALAKHKEQKP